MARNLARFAAFSGIAQLVLATNVFGADPLRIEGEYLCDQVPGFTLTAVNTGGSNYQIRTKEDVAVEGEGCVIAAGTIVANLISAGPSLFKADTFVPSRATPCAFKERSSESDVTLAVRSDGVLIDFVNPSGIDTFFARQGPPVAVPDESSPAVEAMAAAGKTGSRIKLRYTVVENTGSTADIVTIYKGKKVVKVITVPLGAKTPRTEYFVNFKTKNAGSYRFEVISTDSSNNSSAIVSAKIRVKAPK